MRNFLLLCFLILSIGSYGQIRLSDLNVKSSVSGTEKIPVSGSGNPAVTPNLLRTGFFGKSVVVATSATAITLDDDDTDTFYKCSNASLLTVTLPNGLATGHRTKWLKLGAGNIRFVAAGTLEGLDEIQITDGVAEVTNTGSNVWSASGDVGGPIYAFDTFIPISGSNVVATASSETVTLATAGGRVSIAGNSGTNTLTFDVTEANLTLNSIGGTLGVAKGGTNKTATPTNGQLLIGNGTDYTLATVTSTSGITVTNGAGTIALSGGNIDLSSYWGDDFESDATAINGSSRWTEVNSGTAESAFGSTFGVDATENADGVASMTTSTVATARTALVAGTQNCLLGNGVTRRLGWRSAISNLSDGTETFTTYAGYFDQSGAGDATDGAYFRYTHSVNSGKIEAVTRNNGGGAGETAADTGITPVAGQFYRFEVRVNSDGSSVTYYIDGTLVATIGTDVPTGAGRYTGICFKIEKSVGTTARLMYIDYVEQEKVRTTNR